MSQQTHSVKKEQCSDGEISEKISGKVCKSKFVYAVEDGAPVSVLYDKELNSIVEQSDPNRRGSIWTAFTKCIVFELVNEVR